MSYWQHFLAWMRGDLNKITSVFDKAIKDLEAHRVYMNTIADNQAMASRDLASRAKWTYDNAAQAAAVKAKLEALVNV